MTNESIQHQLKIWLTQIDKHLEAAKAAIQEGKTAQAEADIQQSRDEVVQAQSLVAKILSKSHIDQ